MKLTLEKARLLFDAGGLKEATAVHAPMHEGKYLLVFEAKQESGWVSHNLISKRGAIREFSSLEAAQITVKSIGFKGDRVIFQ